CACLGGGVLTLWEGRTRTVSAKSQKTAPPKQAGKQAAPRPAPVASHQAAPATNHNAVIRRYCVGCHNDKTKSGGLSLAAFDAAAAAANAEVTEKVIRKLQAGFMPPPLAARPDPATYSALIRALEHTVDAAASANPNPAV